MKVGTDGVLLASWVSCDKADNILDVGCGTGLITLMLAQRNLSSNITGIEIDNSSSEEAKLNISNSHWGGRIEIIYTSLQQFNSQIKFDLIISNPPFFSQNKSKKSRDIARHTNTLSFEELINNAANLLKKKGVFSVVIPKYYEEYFCEIANIYKLYCIRACYVKGNPSSEVKRVMLEFSFIKSTALVERLTIEISRHNYTYEYIQLCHKFYLNM